VLAVGPARRDYVDAFYGPAEWRKARGSGKVDGWPPSTSRPRRSRRTWPRYGGRARSGDAGLWALRRQYLTRQMSALRARVSMLQGERLTFDEESRALYDAVAPTRTEAEFEPCSSNSRPASPAMDC